MRLIIVESPKKARTLGSFAGTGYRVIATMGHVRDLPGKRLGVDVGNGFAPEYEVLDRAKRTLASIRVRLAVPSSSCWRLTLTVKVRQSRGMSPRHWGCPLGGLLGSCSMRSVSAPCARRWQRLGRLTSHLWMPNKRDVCLIVWSGTGSARFCGVRWRAGLRAGGCSRWRFA